MIELLVVGLIATSQAGQPAQSPPGFDFFVCPGPDPRCRNRPPPISETPPQYSACPDGTMVPPGQHCPAVALTGPAIVYFGVDDLQLDPRAQAILDEVATAVQRHGAALTLSGHTDRAGSAEANVALSERYANQVRDYLLARGVPAGLITIQAFGESRPAVETADGVRELQNRRVEIIFGSSGW